MAEQQEMAAETVNSAVQEEVVATKKPKGWRIKGPAINADEATPFFIYLQLIINAGPAIGTKIYIPTIIAFTFESILFESELWQVSG